MTWFNASYLHKKAITLSHLKVSGSADLSSFPVLVSLTDANLATVANGGFVQNASGYDIIFTDSTETTQLSHEIESYTATNGTLVFWVNVPTLSHTVDTIIYVYFDNSGISSFQSTASSVWDSNFKGVYHLGNGTTLSVADSTSNAYNGTNTGATATTGEVDGAASFNGTSNYITLPSGQVTDGWSTFTIETWIKLSNNTFANFPRVICNDDATATDKVGWNLIVSPSTEGNSGYWNVGIGGTSSTFIGFGSAVFAASTWYHIVVTYDGTTMLSYINGAQSNSKAASGSIGTATHQLHIGTNPTAAGEFFPGVIDEVRLSHAARSAGWITTEYNNQSSPSTFYSVGSLLSDGVHDLSWRGLISKVVDKDLSWRALISKTVDKDLVWRGLLNRPLVDHDLVWRALISKTVDHDLAWRGNVGHVADHDLVWRTLISKTVDHDVTWRGLLLKLVDKDLSWRALVSKLVDKDLSWRGNIAHVIDHDLGWRGKVGHVATHDLAWRGNIGHVIVAPVKVTIGGTSYLFIEESLKITRKLGEARRCQITILDYAGNQFFQYGEQITVTDAVLGVRFVGFVIDDILDKSNTYPDPTIEHQLDCSDNTRLAAKRTSNLVYTVPTPAGKIACDMVSTVLAAEGVTAQYASRFDTTSTDFGRGTLTSVVAGTAGDGDLELSSTGGTLGASYQSQADWSGGSGSSVQLNTDGTVQLIGVTRNWDDGNKTSQSLYGNGNPTDGVSSGQYTLSCTHSSETRSRLDFAGQWQNGTIEVDVTIGADIPKTGLVWRTTQWGNADGSWAYALEFTSTQIEMRLGNDFSGGGSTSSLGLYSFSPKLAYGTYRLRVVMNGTSLSAYINGSFFLSVTDFTFNYAGYIGLRNRNGETSITITDHFDNFGVMASETGTWTSTGTSIASITSVAASIISWDSSLSTGGTVTVQASLDNGSTYQTCTNGSSIPGLPKGTSGSGKTVVIKVTLSNSTTATMPIIRNLSWSVSGGYAASGNRTTSPLAIDYVTRANQSPGFGTSSDGQTYTKTGTGTDAIASNAATITNTTGDVHERLGSATGTDLDGSIRFSLSAATIVASLELRYTDSSNFYRLSASTSVLTLSKMSGGALSTIATTPLALALGSWYRLHMRVVGSAPSLLYGSVWPDGTVEPSSWILTGAG